VEGVGEAAQKKSPAGAGQAGQTEVDESSWSLMELPSIEKSTSVIEALLPSMKLA
jgi:hypothetical protein